jgi:hypothetical protein
MSEPADASLFAVYLGGDPEPGRLSEDHEVVFVVADDVRQARRAARAKWAGLGRPHVDGVRRIGVVDGHRIRLEQTGELETTEVDLTYEPAQEQGS